MNRMFACLGICCAFALFAGVNTIAQSHPAKKDGDSAAHLIVHGGGKAAVIVVGSAAKVGWELTKFGTRNLAAPAAKTLIVKGGPKAAKLMLKSSGFGAKHLLPLAIKLSVL